MVLYDTILYYAVLHTIPTLYSILYTKLYSRILCYLFFKVFMWIDRLSVAPEASEKGQRRGGSGRALVEVI